MAAAAVVAVTAAAAAAVRRWCCWCADRYAWVDAKTFGYAKLLLGLFSLLALYLFYVYLLGPLWYIGSYIPKLILRCGRGRR